MVPSWRPIPRDIGLRKVDRNALAKRSRALPEAAGSVRPGQQLRVILRDYSNIPGGNLLCLVEGRNSAEIRHSNRARRSGYGDVQGSRIARLDVGTLANLGHLGGLSRVSR